MLKHLHLVKLFRRRSVFLFIFLFLISNHLLLTSCAKTNLAKPLEQFSTLTIETTTITRTGIETVRVVDLQKSAAKAANQEALTEADFEPILDLEGLEARFTALRSLDAYTSALSKIASIDKSEDIKKVAESYKGQVEGIFSAVGADKEFSEKAGTISSKIVKAFLSAVINKKKEQAIKDALTSTDPFINELCMLIASEFQRRGPFYDQVKKSYRDLQRSVNNRFENSKKDSEKLKLAEEYGKLIQKKDEILILFQAVALSYEKIAMAHHDLMVQATTGASSQSALSSLSAQINTTKLYYDLVLKK